MKRKLILKLFGCLLLMFFGNVSIVFAESEMEGSTLTIPGVLLGVLFLAIIISLVARNKMKAKIQYMKDHAPKVYEDVSEVELKAIISNVSLEELKNVLKNNYMDIYTSIMNFDFDRLRLLCTDKIYNQYVAEMENMKINGLQHILKNFNFEQFNITRAYRDNNTIVIMSYTNVSQLDYVYNTVTNKVKEGSKVYSATHNYIMTFVYDSEVENFILNELREE